jgi:hypothetical protein
MALGARGRNEHMDDQPASRHSNADGFITQLQGQDAPVTITLLAAEDGKAKTYTGTIKRYDPDSLLMVTTAGLHVLVYTHALASIEQRSSPGGGMIQVHDWGQNRYDEFTERAVKVLTLAREEAPRFNHYYVGTEHLLLGLLRAGEGMAAEVLTNLGVTLDQARTQTLQVLSQSALQHD